MDTTVDLTSTEGGEAYDVEGLPEATALGTWGTYSTASSSSCPISSAFTAMTAS